MKCPICGQELRPGKKDPNYLLCYNCKKKFKMPQKAQKKTESAEEEDKKYSNIPPKKVREKREKEMRDAYDELLSVEDDRKKKKSKPAPKPKRKEELEDDLYDDIDDDYDYDDDDEPGMSKAPIIILAIAIVVVAALIAFMLLR